MAFFDLYFELDLDLLRFKKWSHYIASFHVVFFLCLFSGLVVFLTLSTNIQLFNINKCLLFWLFQHEIKANFKGIYFFVTKESDKFLNWIATVCQQAFHVVTNWVKLIIQAMSKG